MVISQDPVTSSFPMAEKNPYVPAWRKLEKEWRKRAEVWPCEEDHKNQIIMDASDVFFSSPSLQAAMSAAKNFLDHAESNLFSEDYLDGAE